nr:hypothetical protein BaRGS_000484 [Batillaria attramentaria]
MKRERHNMLEEAKQARRKSSADDNKKTNPFATKQTETARTTSKRPLLNLFRDTAKRLSGNKKRVAGLARETTPPEVTSGVGGDREASPPRKMRKIRVESLVNFFRRRGGSDKEPLIRRVSESELHEYQEVGPMKPDGASWSAGCIGRVFTKRNSKGVLRTAEAEGATGSSIAEDEPEIPLTSPSNEKTESFQSDSASGDSDVYVPVTLFIYPPRIIQESDSETCSSHTGKWAGCVKVMVKVKFK